MHLKFVELLACPESGDPLTCEVEAMHGDRVRSGKLLRSDGKSYPIVEFVPRFVAAKNYCDSFSLEWELHPDILYKADSKYDVYDKRFRAETKWEEDLTGELILEAGCGPGAMTEIALARGATMVAIDMSTSIQNVSARMGDNPNLLCVQGDILHLPFRDEAFDKAFCLGVLQHTQSPSDAFRQIVSKLKPGGKVGTDIYGTPENDRLLKHRYFARRFTAGRDPKKLHKLIKAYVALMWPVRTVLNDFVPFGRTINRWMLFDDFEKRLGSIDRKRDKEFAVLDLFDGLASTYDAPQTPEGLRRWFEECGMEDIEVNFGYNGVEGRGTRRATPVSAAKHPSNGVARGTLADASNSRV